MQNKNNIKSGSHFLFANTIVSIEEITTGKYLLTLEKQFKIKAGQVVAITSEEAIPPRIYSICSGENDDYLQILFDLQPAGKLTPFMAGLKTGDELFVSKPYGSFLPSSEMPMWWIATGTGIAPFHSMVKSGYTAQMLLHGARNGSTFYFERDFKLALKQNYIRCSSGSDGIGDFFGHVSKYIDSLEQLPKNNKYYLCGRALMVVEVRDLLISKGIAYENIISEIFF